MRRHRHQAAVVALILLAIGGAYAAAYWIALDHSARAYIWCSNGELLTPRVEAYRWGGPAARYAFWPAHRIDRRLRAEHWSAE